MLEFFLDMGEERKEIEIPEVPDWSEKWVKPEGSRRKGSDLFWFGDEGDFVTEAEFRKAKSRREFLSRWLPGGTLAFLAVGSATVAWLADEAEERKRRERLVDEQAPQIRGLLVDTLQSGRLDNLGLFTNPVQEDIIRVTINSQEGLFSNDTELRNRSRWEIARYIFGIYYHYPDSTIFEYDDYKETGTGKLYFAFLDETVGKIDQETIRSQSGAHQANMWVEAYFRASAYSRGFDASQNGGVYTSRGFAKSGFVPLQYHSPFPGGQP